METVQRCWRELAGGWSRNLIVIKQAKVGVALFVMKSVDPDGFSLEWRWTGVGMLKTGAQPFSKGVEYYCCSPSHARQRRQNFMHQADTDGVVDADNDDTEVVDDNDVGADADVVAEDAAWQAKDGGTAEDADAGADAEDAANAVTTEDENAKDVTEDSAVAAEDTVAADAAEDAEDAANDAVADEVAGDAVAVEVVVEVAENSCC